tara:strand:+ start:11572 stop:14046 length:2475 start_codon:yes stop_codon:yes gene_type:complete
MYKFKSKILNKDSNKMSNSDYKIGDFFVKTENKKDLMKTIVYSLKDSSADKPDKDIIGLISRSQRRSTRLHKNELIIDSQYKNSLSIIKDSLIWLKSEIEESTYINYKFLIKRDTDDEIGNGSDYFWAISKQHLINHLINLKLLEGISDEIYKELWWNVNNSASFYSGDNFKLTNIVITTRNTSFNEKTSPYNKIPKSWKFSGKKILIQPPEVTKKKGGIFIELPNCLKSLHALLNIKNKDNLCFVWCILAFLYPVEKDANRVTKYKEHFNKINTNSLNFPVHLNDIETFADANNLIIRIWELRGLDTETNTKNIDLICLNNRDFNSEFDTNKKTVHLLLYKQHYILIKNLSNLVKWTINVKTPIKICPYCFSCHFHSIGALNNHIDRCISNNDKMKFKLPINVKKNICFKNIQNKFKCVYTLYADFESILKPVNTKFGDASEKINEHKAIAVGYVLKCSNNNTIKEHYMYGDDCIIQFFNQIDEIIIKIKNEMCHVFKNIKIKRSPENASKQNCHLCEKLIEKGQNYYYIDNEKVFNDQLLISHQKCFHFCLNRLFSLKVFFHNLKGYDSHFLVDEFAQRCINFTAIPISKEKYISFQGDINNVSVKFLDSLAFLNGSLASNANKLTNFKYIGSNENISNMKLDFLLKYKSKQAFPYEYITSKEIIENEKLPTDKNHWFSTLTGKYPLDSDIEFALTTFKDLNMKNIKDYMMFYLRIDVLLLLEVFEAFRDLSISEYDLDPAHYYTTPGLAWDAALKFSGQSLDILNDKKLVSFFCEEGTIRGGISTVSERKWAEASENSDKKSSIFYFDVTNLYGKLLFLYI